MQEDFDFTDRLSEWSEGVVVRTPPAPERRSGPQRAMPASIALMCVLLVAVVVVRYAGADQTTTMTASDPGAEEQSTPGTTVLNDGEAGSQSRVTVDGVELNLTVHSTSDLLTRYIERMRPSGPPDHCLPDLSYGVRTGIDGQPATRPNSDATSEQVTFAHSPDPVTFHASHGLAADSDFQVLANAYVVRLDDPTIEAVTLFAGGVERDTASVSGGWVVLGFRAPPAVDGDVARASGVYESVGITLHRPGGDQYIDFTGYDPASNIPSCR